MAVSNAIENATAAPVRGDGRCYSRVDSTAPAAPANPDVDAQSATTIRFSWDAPVDPASAVVSVKLYAGTVNGGPYTLRHTVASDDPAFEACECDVSGFESSTLYYCKITAVDAFGNETALASATQVSDTTGAGNSTDPLPPINALQIVWPRQAGTRPSPEDQPFPSGHHILSTHTQVPYRIFANPRGGMPPYLHEVEGDLPPGMTCDPETGLITAPAFSGTYTPTYRLTDAHGNSVTEQWTITPNDSLYRFFSTSGSDAAAGTIAAPWRDPVKTRNGSMNGNQFAIFRAGNYSVVNMYANGVTQRTVTTASFTPTTTSFELTGTTSVEGQVVGFGGAVGYALVTGGSVQGSNFRVTSLHAPLGQAPTHNAVCGIGNSWQRTNISASSGCVKWKAYPGEAVNFDHHFQGPTTDWGALVRFTGNSTNPVCVIGIKPTNALDKCFQFASGSCHYVDFGDFTVDENVADAGIEGSNSGVIMQLDSGVSDYFFAHDITCTNAPIAPLKTYYQRKPHYHRITCDGGSSWDLKDSQTDFEEQDCVSKNCTHPTDAGFFGNMDNGAAATRGVYYFSYADARNGPANAYASDCGQNGTVGRIDYIRCTLIGRVLARNVGASQGPINYVRTIHENADSGDTDRIHQESCAVGRVAGSEVLSGAIGDHCDTSGLLTGASRTTYLGIRGWEKDT